MKWLMVVLFVLLTWQDNSNNETNFVVERANSATGAFAIIGFTFENEPSFNDPMIIDGACYRVAAINADGQSAYSNTACLPVAAPPPPPEGEPPTIKCNRFRRPVWDARRNRWVCK
jgi:hypothetical protein